jgi:RNA recognition motif-containing protein
VKDEEGKNRGFGFVTMRTADGGDKAIAELDGTSVRGRNLAVRASNT